MLTIIKTRASNDGSRKLVCNLIYASREFVSDSSQIKKMQPQLFNTYKNVIKFQTAIYCIHADNAKSFNPASISKLRRNTSLPTNISYPTMLVKIMRNCKKIVKI